MHPGPRLIAAAILLAAAAGGLGTTPAAAQACAVSSEPVAFDPYDPVAGLPSDGIGTVRLRCDRPASAEVGLGPGARAEGGWRAMTGPGAALRYGLFSDPSRLLPWGDGTAAPRRPAQGPEADLTVYGRIPAGQNVPSGHYADAVTITLSF